MIYVTGSLAFDFIMDYPGKFADQIVPEKIHLINLSFLVNTLKEGKGGTAGNIAYNVSLLHNAVAIVGSAGKDFDEYRAFLAKHKVVTDFIHIVKNDFTARAYITTDLADNQITGFYPGTLHYNKQLSLPKQTTPSDFVVIAPDDPEAMAHYVDQCSAESIPFMFDPGMQLPRLPAEVLQKGTTHAVIVIGNDYEMALLKSKIKNSPTQGRSPTLKRRRTKSQIPRKQIWITTLGEKGSVIEIKDLRCFNRSDVTIGLRIEASESPTASVGQISTIKTITIRAVRPKKAVDPTGAGDAYRAGFVTGYLQKRDLQTCGQMGSIAAVYAVEKYGTMEHYYTTDTFWKRYKENFGNKL